jgi:hypothetical protein
MKRKERPFVANYSIALLIVMGVNMFFNCMTVLMYPDLFESDLYTGEAYLYLFLAVSLWEMSLAIFMFLGSGIAYKLTWITMVTLLTLSITNMIAGGRLGFDIWLQVILGFLVLLIDMLPVVKNYYDNWSPGTLPPSEL